MATDERCLKTVIIDPKRARFCLEPKGHEGKHKTIYLGREMTWECTQKYSSDPK